jgi:hypothetical protein
MAKGLQAMELTMTPAFDERGSILDMEAGKRELLHEMKVTKGSRFNAAERLRRRDRRMITITAFASVYVIVLTIMPLFFHVGEAITGVLNAITICFSIIILASSLLQYSNNDPVRAEQHHRCALEINALRRELRATESTNYQILFESGKRYDEILQKYSLNHDPIDFIKYKLEHPHEYPDQGREKDRADTEELEGIWSFGKRVVIAMTTATIFAALISVAQSIVKNFPNLSSLLDRLSP